MFKIANLAVTFFLELGVLVALGYWGFHTGQGTIASIGLGLGVPAAAVVLWALFGAPTARWHLNGGYRVLLQIVFFGSAALALAAAVSLTWSVAWSILCIVNITLNYVWGNDPKIVKTRH